MALEFRCRDVGVACRGKVTADDPDELVDKVKEHARTAHDVELTQTLVDFAKTKVRTVQGGGERSG